MIFHSGIMDFSMEFLRWNIPFPVIVSWVPLSLLSLFSQVEPGWASPLSKEHKSKTNNYDSSKMNAFLAVAQPEDVEQYRSVFHRFMAYKLGRPVTFTPAGRVEIDAFPKDHVFTNDELTTINPMHICHWFCLMAYNKESPNRDDRPTKCASNTLKYHKRQSHISCPITYHHGTTFT